MRWPLCVIAVLCLCLSFFRAGAQQNDIPLNREIYLDLERNAACRSSTMHSGLKPLIESRADKTGVMGYRADSSRQYYRIGELMFKYHMFDIHDGDFRVTIDPVFHFEGGQDFRDPTEFSDTTRFYVNSRGLMVRCDLGPRLSFQTSFYENQAIYPQYIYLYCFRLSEEYGVVPGQGRIKGFKNRAFDFAWAAGNVSWSPRKWLNVQFGNGKHFVGHGYRSMLLSDNAFNYPYLKLSYLGPGEKFQYSTIHAKLQMLERLPTGESSESLFYWKRASFHHLSYHLGRVDLGLFEATIFHKIDSLGVLPLDPLELNPIIGINTLVNGFDGEHKSLIGLDTRVKVTDKTYVYGQFALDDPDEERYAYQGGIRLFDFPVKDLNLQLEYNSATAYTYAHKPALVNYGHYSQPLAHPAGANFSEAVAIVDWRFKLSERWKFMVTAKMNFIEYHVDQVDSLNFGGEIFKPAEVYEGDQSPLVRHVVLMDLSASWLMNQMTNMQITLGYRIRDAVPAPDQLNSGYFYGSWHTTLFNKYYDF